MIKTIHCPKCSCAPVFRMVDDYKQYVVLQCPYFGYIAVRIDEANHTKRDAIKIME